MPEKWAYIFDLVARKIVPLLSNKVELMLLT